MKLQSLIRRWLREAKRFEAETLKEAMRNRYAANRYEGISCGYRWAAEDLKAATRKRRKVKH